MTNTLYRLGYKTVTPAVPYSPARPAYTSIETLTGIRLGPPTTTIGAWVTSRNPVSGAMETVWDPTFPVGTRPTQSYTYTVTTFHPATAEVLGSPPVTVAVPPLGWTSFAHSKANALGGARISFKVPKGVYGAAVGVTSTLVPTPGYGHLFNGMLFSAGAVRTLLGSALGTYVDSDVFTMDVAASGRAVFKKNGAVIGSEAAKVPPGSALYLAAALYSPGDFVDTPAISQLYSGTFPATMRGFEGLLSDHATAQFKGSMRRMEGAWGVRNRYAGIMRGFEGFMSDHDGMQVLGRMQGFEGAWYGGLPPVTGNNSFVVTMRGLEGVSIITVGQLLTARAQMQGMAGFWSDHATSQFRGVMQGFSGGWAADFTPGTLNLIDAVVVDIPLVAVKANRVDLSSAFSVSVDTSAARIVPVRLEDSVELDVALTAGGTRQIALIDTVVLDVAITTPGADLEVHAVNLDGYGSTAYANYAFNSFARIGDRYYGARLDGLFLLEGEDDDGVPVDANFSPGKLDFGTSTEKTLAEVYIGVASPEPMLLRAAVPAGVFDYEALSSSEELRQHRFKLGKGLKANYLTPVFYNQDGSDFEVDSLEFSVADLSRKTKA